MNPHESQLIERKVVQTVLDSPVTLPKSNRGNPFIIFLSLLLSVLLFASFIAWWRDAGLASTSLIFRLFVWVLVVSDVFLLITRALREWANNR